jgi:uncharacterized protein YjbI with pentapeptide repeats
MAASLQRPERALVRPRVTVRGGTVPRLLEEEVTELLARGRATAVQLLGPQQSGRTTALAHLAALFAGDPRLGLFDTDHSGWAGQLLTVEACERAEGGATVLELVPWSDDDALEYLLAAHRRRAAAAFAAWQRQQHGRGLGRWPGLCCTVLDQLAAGNAEDVIGALRLVMDAQLCGGSRVIARSVALSHATSDDSFSTRSPDPELPLLAVPLVRAVLAAERMLEIALRGQMIPLPRVYWSADLLTAVRALVTGPDEQRLQELCKQIDGVHPASVTSLLCVARPGFRPPGTAFDGLAAAYLAGADLRRLRLRGPLDGANLDGADLREADLREASADQVRMAGACIEGTVLDGIKAHGLSGMGVRGDHARLAEANLRSADLSHAVLDRADLHGAILTYADLAGTSLRGADLCSAHLMHARLLGTDLRDARCCAATLAQVDLRTALLDGADLYQANLEGADLSGLCLPALRAPGARFRRAWLTGTRFPDANLFGASFAEAGLADVDWHGADLRDCDFTRAAFHLGSSRSGLVDSEVAGEGSRTGFYTDESLEDRFQAPEDVRKADLRGCDLRGARVEGCDFYLVDLRGAKLDREQIVWLRRCRAILDPGAGAD